MMKKFRLDDLKKNRLFSDPPQDYFDKLPGIIQAKTANQPRTQSQTYWIGALKLIPVAALMVLIALYSGLLNNEKSVPGFNVILSEVSSDDIIQYLEELDISNEEILAEVDMNALSFEFDDTQDPLIDNLNIEDEALMQLYDDFDVQDSLL